MEYRLKNSTKCKDDRITVELETENKGMGDGEKKRITILTDKAHLQITKKFYETGWTSNYYPLNCLFN